jgi:uncharacterized membrane protein SpoIIM required for sporulation
MSQKGFQEKNARLWREVSQLLDVMDRGTPVTGGDTFPARYRQICQHLALARHRRFSSEVIEGLNRLSLRGHQHLYARRFRPFQRVGDFIGRDLPRAVRREWKLVVLAIALFFGTGAAADVAVHLKPDLAYTILGPGMVAQLEMMYDPTSDHFLRERASDSDLAMFGFYIRNNIGIGFRTFASGLLLGLGSIFFLVFNGVFMGGAAGHIDVVGYGSTFYSFVIGHGAFELTAIALAGASGLKLGTAVLAPGRRSRALALVEEGKRAVSIVYGFTGMLVIAAFLEAFWSSSTLVPATVKLIVGGVFWVLVIGYFAFAGRRGSAA